MRPRVTNTLSTGPGTPVETYELTGGSYVYRVGDRWKLQRPGQYAVIVALEVPRCPGCNDRGRVLSERGGTCACPECE